MAPIRRIQQFKNQVIEVGMTLPNIISNNLLGELILIPTTLGSAELRILGLQRGDTSERIPLIYKFQLLSGHLRQVAAVSRTDILATINPDCGEEVGFSLEQGSREEYICLRLEHFL